MQMVLIIYESLTQLYLIEYRSLALIERLCTVTEKDTFDSEFERSSNPKSLQQIDTIVRFRISRYLDYKEKINAIELFY